MKYEYGLKNCNEPNYETEKVLRFVIIQRRLETFVFSLKNLWVLVLRIRLEFYPWQSKAISKLNC